MRLVGTAAADLFWIALAAVLIYEWRNRMPMNERCRDCNAGADFRCEGREVGERRTIEKRGEKVVQQPYLTFFLCAGCCKIAVASDDPPRQVIALPHHQAVLTRRRPPVEELVVERLGDWGRPT